MNISVRTIIAALAGAGTLGAASAAWATDYSDDYTVDPSTFNCGYFGSTAICAAKSTFSDGPRSLQVGDHLSETVTYTKRVVVPGSKGLSVLTLVLYDQNLAPGVVTIGPDVATSYATVYGSSPTYHRIPGPFTIGINDGYWGGALFYNQESFSATGLNVHSTIDAADPTPMEGAIYGWSAELPATPQLISGMQGGTVDHPAILPSGLVGQISSNISGGSSDSQFYTFDWKGGLFQTKGTIVGANPLADFHFELLFPGGGTPIVDQVLDQSNGFSSLMSFANLGKGQYEIGMFTDSPYDPGFTIHFNTPAGSVPESSTWALLIAGIAGCGVPLRRRRADRKAES
jgi:hypothetical protein